MVDGENKNMNGVDKYVSAALVKKMLGLIQASIDDGDGFDQHEWLDFVEQMPSVEWDERKDCRWHEGKRLCCNIGNFGFEDDDFCSQGERKERGGNG